MNQGAQIVFLNGASSSGKTSIARQLLLVLGRPYFHFSVDAFHAMRAAEPTEPIDERTVLGFHRAVAGMAAAGNDIVVDHALAQPHWFADCVEQWRDHDVVFVGVHCALPELNRRERLRDDRETGLAARQFSRVHTHGDYDLECDTEANHPRDCALQIKAFLNKQSLNGQSLNEQSLNRQSLNGQSLVDGDQLRAFGKQRESLAPLT